MYVLFAGAFPPPHYGASLFLTSIVAMYLLRKCCAFRDVKHFFITGLVFVGLIALHFVWFGVEYPDREVIQLIDSAFMPAGLIGAVLGFFLGTFKYQRLRQAQEKNNEETDTTSPQEPQV